MILVYCKNVRKKFKSVEVIEHYYKIVPIIVDAINNEKNNIIYNYIYDNVIDYCVEQIKNGNYEESYNRYIDF